MTAMRRPSTRQPQIPDYAVENFGPAMRALTPVRQAFVLALEAEGWQPKSWAKAAYSAGIAGNMAAASVWASRARRDEKVKAAIREEILRYNEAVRGPRALAIIDDLAETADSSSVRLKAAESQAARAGYGIVHEQRVVVEHRNRSTKEILEDMKRLAIESGEESNPLIADIIEGEFEEVVADELAEPASQSEPEDDLSDILGEPMAEEIEDDLKDILA